MKEIRISATENGMKAEKFVRKYLSEAPLGFIYKLFRLKDVKVNGHWVKKDHVLCEGDTVRLYVTDQQLEDFNKPRPVTKAKFPYAIAYEDEHILIAEKPVGLLVYGDSKEKRKTLTNAVLDYLYLKEEYKPGSGFSPSPAHRLDRNTAGLVIFAKDDASLKVLEDAFKERKGIEKKYWALVEGITKEQGKIDLPLKKDAAQGLVKLTPIEKGGQNALTTYRLIKKYGEYSLLEVTLHTGRTHQIRVHLSSVGHPILGDPKYGDFTLNKTLKDKYGLSSQWLLARDLEFGKLPKPLDYLDGKKIEASVPAVFENMLKAL